MPTSPSERAFIGSDEAQALRQAHLLIEESHRVRPRYFDGKFLAARDLTRDQAYFLSRQAGFARALGAGVVDGLEVVGGAQADQIVVSAGFGYTAGGELVSLQQSLTASLAQLFKLQTLAAQLGTLERPAPPLRNRSGVFVLGLRALEFAANPVGAYPSSLDGPRQVEEGDIVEAGALTLAPLTALTGAAADDFDRARSDLARAAFVDDAFPPLPAELLPLAVLAIAGDDVRWIDMHLVRRRAGQMRSDPLGFGFAPRPLREAQLAQYLAQFGAIARAGFAGRPNAAQYFSVLPPAGVLPAAALDRGDFSQSWFPPGVNAELMLLPDDEAAALVDEALRLPPIDLGLDAAAQESTHVAILIPVERRLLAQTAARLEQRLARRVAAPATRLFAKRMPLDALRLLSARRLAMAEAPAAPAADPIDTVWAELLSAQNLLWYVRQRNLALRPEIDGQAVVLIDDDTPVPVERRLSSASDQMLAARRDKLLGRASVYAAAELTRLLSAPRFAASPLLAEVALMQIERVSDGHAFGSAEVAQVTATLTTPGFGEGLKRLQQLRPELRDDSAAITRLANHERVLDLDRRLAHVDRFELKRLAERLKLPARGRANLDALLAPPGA